MKEPKRIPLDPETPRPNQVKKIPMPSLEQEQEEKKYPEPIQDDVYSQSEEKEQNFWNFIADCEESRKKWKEKQDKLNKEKN